MQVQPGLIIRMKGVEIWNGQIHGDFCYGSSVSSGSKMAPICTEDFDPLIVSALLSDLKQNKEMQEAEKNANEACHIG